MTCSTLCSQPATMHCGELISMKDCGLWATMTYKLSSNFCLVLSAPLCLRRCRAPALTGALKCSPSDQQLRGVGRERERRRGRGGRKKKKRWVFPWPRVCLWICACLFVFSSCDGWQGEKSDWLLSSVSIIILPLARLPLFPALCSPPGACLYSVWSTALWCFTPH